MLISAAELLPTGPTGTLLMPLHFEDFELFDKWTAQIEISDLLLRGVLLEVCKSVRFKPNHTNVHTDVVQTHQLISVVLQTLNNRWQHFNILCPLCVSALQEPRNIF